MRFPWAAASSHAATCELKSAKQFRLLHEKSFPVISSLAIMPSNTVIDNNPILQVTELEKHYPLGRGLIGSVLSRPEQIVRALDSVSFSLKRGEILGLVGESGSGKSTTALSILGLTTPTKGNIL